MRGAEPLALLERDRCAFVLAYSIAARANWREGFNAKGLAAGEAFLGDFEAYGLTRQEYRTAIRHLKEWGFATFKPTSEGTIAKLTDTRLFDVFPQRPNQQANHQPTISQPSGNHQVTTNEEREERKRTERAKELIEGTDRFIGAVPFSSDKRPDWHGLSIAQKLDQVLGQNEMARCRDRWLRRAQDEPARLARVIDTMHSELLESKIIKNRGGYAEDLWKRFEPTSAPEHEPQKRGTVATSEPPSKRSPKASSLFASSIAPNQRQGWDCPPEVAKPHFDAARRAIDGKDDSPAPT